MAVRVATVWAILALGTVILPAVATADGDPASDVLLGENVFYPYTPPVSGAAQRTLNAETEAAKRAGFPIKVALIASPVDLGVIPALFNHPQQYANFLDVEISFQGKQPLLVVMPAGYGVQGVAASAMAAVRRLRPPAGKTSTDLAQAAVSAVATLATAAGHPSAGVTRPPARDTAGGAGSSAAPIVIVLALAVAAALTTAVLIVRRRRPAARKASRSSRRARRPR